jgi:hypothetical protein
MNRVHVQQQHTMKVLIRSKDTGLYLTEGCRWVKDIAQARDFERAPEAILHAGNLGLKNIELTYAFPNAKQNITFPLSGFGEAPPQNPVEG